MKLYILAFGIAYALFSCGTNERTHLRKEVDSLADVLNQNKKAEAALNEIGITLDSIDSYRHALGVDITKGMSYANYINRIRDINAKIKDSEAKITALEKDLNISISAFLATIRRLKTDLEERSKELVSLQAAVANLREHSRVLLLNVIREDSILSSKDEMIKLKYAALAFLEEQLQETTVQNRIKVAQLYFAQARALEAVANRTKFAPNKKKEMRMEALELYKLAFSLGNAEAEAKIQELEEELS